MEAIKDAYGQDRAGSLLSGLRGEMAENSHLLRA